jgi:DNA-binding transcriptional ArsR family regulator
MSRYNRTFETISDKKRIKVLFLLLKERGEFYVCEIADAL